MILNIGDSFGLAGLGLREKGVQEDAYRFCAYMMDALAFVDGCMYVLMDV